MPRERGPAFLSGFEWRHSRFKVVVIQFGELQRDGDGGLPQSPGCLVDEPAPHDLELFKCHFPWKQTPD